MRPATGRPRSRSSLIASVVSFSLEKDHGSDNSLKWPQIIKRGKGTTSRVEYTVETRYVIFIKKFSEFLPPKPDRKYSHTNSYIFAVLALSVGLDCLWSSMQNMNGRWLGFDAAQLRDFGVFPESFP